MGRPGGVLSERRSSEEGKAEGRVFPGFSEILNGMHLSQVSEQHSKKAVREPIVKYIFLIMQKFTFVDYNCI
jgi:hypothetical protein